MLRISVGKSSSCCDGLHRRDFLQIGSLGLGGLSLAQLLAAREATAQSGGTANDRSVIWLWLGGGPTHVETFDPKMTAPAEYRSITGEVQTCLPGVSIGGTFPKIAALADKMAFVRSFAHTNSGHGGGTHYLMTGFDNRTVDNGGPPSRPSLGSTVARVRGANHPVTGVPRYVRYGQIGSDGASYLGAAYAPFDPRGEAL